MSRDQCCVERSCDVSRDVSCDLSGDWPRDEACDCACDFECTWLEAENLIGCHTGSMLSRMSIFILGDIFVLRASLTECTYATYLLRQHCSPHFWSGQSYVRYRCDLQGNLGLYQVWKWTDHSGWEVSLSRRQHGICFTTGLPHLARILEALSHLLLGPFDDKTVAETNASSWLNGLLQSAHGRRFRHKLI